MENENTAHKISHETCFQGLVEAITVIEEQGKSLRELLCKFGECGELILLVIATEVHLKVVHLSYEYDQNCSGTMLARSSKVKQWLSTETVFVTFMHQMVKEELRLSGGAFSMG